MKRTWLILLSVIAFTGQSKAQDLLGGTIRIEWKINLTYQVNVDLYTRTSANIDRQQIIINWGDGLTDTLQTTENPIANDVSLYSYNELHTYPGPGIYTVYVQDSFRIDSILNISNSINESLYLENLLTIGTNDTNSSPELLNLLVDFAIKNEQFVYNPGAYDMEGDSLSYTLLPPTATNSSIPANMTVNPVSGDITWDAPQNLGDIVVVGLLIEEWRNGTIKIGSSITELYFGVIYLSGVENSSPEIGNISVFPNPTTGLITVTGLPDEPASITVYNVLGELVHNQRNLFNDLVIDLQGLPGGLYFLQVHQGQTTLKKKIIKL